MMKPTRICYSSRSIFQRTTSRKIILAVMLLGVFFAMVLSPIPAYPQQVMVHPNAKNALVIVVEENTAQSFSVTWSGMSNAMRNMVLKNLLPKDVRSTIETINNTLRTVIPQVDILSVAEEQLRRHVAAMMKQTVRNARSQFGLPGSGCISGILDTIALQAPAVGNDMYKVFKDKYGESGMANCLKETALPYYYHVEVLTDREASFQRFKEVLLKLHREGYTIDILLDIHGCGESATMNNKKCEPPGLSFFNLDRRNVDQIKTLDDDNKGQKLKLNAVYMVSCWGSEYSEAWNTIGARANNGPRELNYYVLLSPLVFLDAFTRQEMSLNAAAQRAYDVEKILLNGISFPVKIDLRPDLNRLLPIRYVAPNPCGVKLPAVGWVGLSTRIDYRGNKDYCIGQVGPQKFEFQKSCPVGYTMVVQKGDDKCKQDLLGPLRDQAHWNFDIGPSYGAAVDMALGTIYGENKKKPVDNKTSSKRVHHGNKLVRQALVCRGIGKNLCFGAAGEMCGGIPVPGLPQGEHWGCTGTQCVINAGSFMHDECCFKLNQEGRKKEGTACGATYLVGTECNIEAVWALQRFTHNLSWKRWVDTCVDNTRGIVHHDEYCAPAGTIVGIVDAFACCNKKVRAYNPVDSQDQRRAKTQGVKMDGSFIPAVCE